MISGVLDRGLVMEAVERIAALPAVLERPKMFRIARI